MVNPVKLVDGKLPVEAPPHDTVLGAVVAGLLTMVAIALIVGAYVVTEANVGTHFIYADF